MCRVRLAAPSGGPRDAQTVPAAVADGAPPARAVTRDWPPRPPPLCRPFRRTTGNETLPVYKTKGMISVLPVLLLFFIPM